MYLNEVAGYMQLSFTFHLFIAFVRCDSAVWNRLPVAVARVFFRIMYFPYLRVVPVSTL